MGLNLNGQVAVVTGAGRGIGRAIAQRLARAGAHAVLSARTAAPLAETERAIRAAGGSAEAAPADVADEEQVRSLFRRVTERHGRVDILVNNAGLGVFGPLADTSAADFDRVMAVNLRGAFLCCREALRLMAPRRRGTIINISSVVGFRGYPNQSAYAASKHGLMGLTKSLAVEAQPHGIRVSAVLPGGVDTDMSRQSRPDLKADDLMQPEDIAQAVEFLLSLSDRASVDEIYIRRRASKPF